MDGIQYTLRGVSTEMDEALREEAKKSGQSLNSVLISKLAEALHLGTKKTTNTDFDEFANSWAPDPGFDDAIREFERIDEEAWK